jgi:hypothetical protein
MKQKNKNRIITTLIVLSTIGLLSGCNTKSSYYKVAEDAFITLEENGTTILHKGEVVPQLAGLTKFSSDAYYAGVCELTFQCGETLKAPDGFRVYNSKPSDTKYDEVCDHCFPG